MSKGEQSPPLRYFSTYPELEDIKAPLHAIKSSAEEKKKFYPSTFHALVHDDNPYLLTGYRKMPVDCFRKCTESVLTLHNDVVNIWSHLLGALYLLYAWWTAWQEMSALNVSLEERIAFSLNLLGTVVTFLISAGYHTYRPHSESVYHFCLACDLRGICLMTFVGNALTISLAMRSMIHWRSVWLTINFVILVSLNLWIPKMVKHRLTMQRTLYFSVHAGMSAFCWVHRYIFLTNYQHEHESTLRWRHLRHIGVSYIFVSLGLIIKVFHLPERWFPKTFDMFGASHQLFHFITTAGAIVSHHYVMDMMREGIFTK
ncbi:adiponectin receptor ADIPOR [Acrasis kona]|uniref:Adiponectin receptor ADIPOR n=1 Tax=Acrasis kona TaxID=1008807 RepID=A0AAW2Z093_9EUKA